VEALPVSKLNTFSLLTLCKTVFPLFIICLSVELPVQIIVLYSIFRLLIKCAALYPISPWPQSLVFHLFIRESGLSSISVCNCFVCNFSLFISKFTQSTASFLPVAKSFHELGNMPSLSPTLFNCFSIVFQQNLPSFNLARLSLWPWPRPPAFQVFSGIGIHTTPIIVSISFLFYRISHSIAPKEN